MNDYTTIKQYYQRAFRQHGDTPEGLAWQNKAGMETRFNVMTDLIRREFSSDTTKQQQVRAEIRVLDLGCGTGHLSSHLHRAMPNVVYEGIDINPDVIDFCKNEYPDNGNFSARDILKNPLPDNYCDYIIANGILTVKDNLSFDEMWDFAKKLIAAIYRSASSGIAFNVMSKQVDWERDDLFHLPLDVLAEFLTKNVSRDFIIRNDYKLFEYTTYIYKQHYSHRP